MAADDGDGSRRPKGATTGLRYDVLSFFAPVRRLHSPHRDTFSLGLYVVVTGVLAAAVWHFSTVTTVRTLQVSSLQEAEQCDDFTARRLRALYTGTFNVELTQAHYPRLSGLGADDPRVSGVYQVMIPSGTLLSTLSNLPPLSSSFAPGWVQILRQLVSGGAPSLASPSPCNASSCNRAVNTWRIMAADATNTDIYSKPVVSIQLNSVILSGRVCGGFVENSDNKIWALDMGNPPDLRMHACVNVHSLLWSSSAQAPVIDGQGVQEPPPCNYCNTPFERNDFDFFFNITSDAIRKDIVAQEFPFQCFVTGRLDWVQQATLDTGVFSFVIGLSRFVYLAASRV